MPVRLVQTYDGAWVLNGESVAHVPSEYVRDGALTDKATATLAAQSFPLVDDERSSSPATLTCRPSPTWPPPSPRP